MRKKNDAEALDAKRQKAREDHFKNSTPKFRIWQKVGLSRNV